MDSFTANGPHILVDTTDFDKVKIDALMKKIEKERENIWKIAENMVNIGSQGLAEKGREAVVQKNCSLSPFFMVLSS